MTTTLEAPIAARWATAADLLQELGDLLHALGDMPPSRVRMRPWPGTATLEDMADANDRKDGAVCEWVEGTLVEKAMGSYEDWVGQLIWSEIHNYVRAHRLGIVTGSTGSWRLSPSAARIPDVSFVSHARLATGVFRPGGPSAPAIVPDLAVEVLSDSNTAAEMARKRVDYFAAGVRLVWEIEPVLRSATVYTGLHQPTAVPPNGSLDGGEVLPGFRLSLAVVFGGADADLIPPTTG